MVSEHDQGSNHDRAFNAAAKRFPQAEFAIRRLLRSNDAFREICEELAEAEVALAKVPENVAALCEVRQREWQELVDELVSELEKTLKRSDPFIAD